MNRKKIIIYGLLALFIMGSACEKQRMLISTGDILDIFSTSTTIEGYVICEGEGFKLFGHCYSTTPGPTISSPRTESGSTIGVGTFTSCLINLEPGTTYYVRAYISSFGKTVYGDEISFTTAD